MNAEQARETARTADGKFGTQPSAEASGIELIQAKAREQKALTASAPSLLLAHVSDPIRDAIPDAAYIIVDANPGDPVTLASVHDDQGNELDWGDLDETTVNHELDRVDLAAWADVASDRAKLPGELSDPWAFGEVIALPEPDAFALEGDPLAAANRLRTQRINETKALLAKQIHAVYPDAAWAVVEPDEDDESAVVIGIYNKAGGLLGEDDDEFEDVASLLDNAEWLEASTAGCPGRVDIGFGHAISLEPTENQS